MNGQNDTVRPVIPDPLFQSVATAVSGGMPPASESAEIQSQADASVASLVGVLSRINECFLRLSSDEVYSDVLDEVLKALESEYGILGYIDRSHRLVCPSLTRRVWDRCEMADKKIVFELDELGGVLAQVIKQRITVCVNQPVPTPSGHVPITRFLGVPLIVQERLVGVIFLANKPSDYTQEDVCTLEMIARFLAPIIDAHVREEQEKEKRIEYEKRLAIQTQQLKRRNRQLECLAGLSDLAERGASIEEMVELTSYLLAGIFQDLPNVYSRIIFRGQVYQAESYEETEHKLSAAIFLADEYVGAVEICCPEELLHDEGFAIYRMFVNELAERLSTVLTRKKVEEEIHAFRRQTELVLEVTRTGLSIVDQECRLIYVDPWRRAVYGDYRGKTTHEYFCGTTEPCWDCPTARALRTKMRVTQERIMPREGNRPVQTTAIPFLAPDGKWYISEITVDLTDRKRWEDRLVQAERLEAIGHLAEILSREMNSPLQYLEHNLHFLRESWCEISKTLQQLAARARGSLTTSEESPLDEELLTREFPDALEETLAGVRRLAKIVQTLRTFAQPDETEKTIQDLNAVIQAAVDVTYSHVSKVADIVTEFDSTLPRIPLAAGAFGQAVSHLLLGAAEAIEKRRNHDGKGLITIRTRRLDTDWVEIEFFDNGAGMHPQERKNFLEPYFAHQPASVTSRRSLVHLYRVIVEGHQGSVDVESEENSGTRIVVRLPTHDLHQASAHASQLTSLIASDQAAAPPDTTTFLNGNVSHISSGE